MEKPKGFQNIKQEGMRQVLLKNGHLLTLRPAHQEDAEPLIAYLNQVGGESDNLLFGAGEFQLTIEQEQAFLAQAEQDDQTLMLLGIINEEIVSVSTISGAKRKRIAHNSDLSISVKKTHWGLGIGKAVMEELIAFARANEAIKIVSLGVKKSNTNAQALYLKLGFEEIGVRKKFFYINGEYDDEILMDLELGE